MIDERVVLREIDLEVAGGQYVAVLGANGAGKTTLLNIVATLTQRDERRAAAVWGGVGGRRRGGKVRRRIGMIGHQGMLYRDLTARENLVFFGRLYGVPEAWAAGGGTALARGVGGAGRRCGEDV